MYKTFVKSILFLTLSSSVFAQQVSRFEQALQCHTSMDNPGLVLRVEHKGEVVFQSASGVKSLASKEPLTTSDQFQIGSLTKQFTAAAILRLSEQGKLSLTDDLITFIPSLSEDYSGINLLHLLTHTAGLTDYFGVRQIADKWHKYAEVEDIIKEIVRIPVQGEPGGQYRYSNVGYLLLGRVIERVSGMRFGDFIRAQFFKPLEMTRSFVMERGHTVETVIGYTQVGSDYVKTDVVDRSWIYAAGAIVSTLDDMSRWHKALLAGRVISQTSYQLMTSKGSLSSGASINYGLGLDIYSISNRHSYSHQGMVPGFAAWMVYFPEDDLFGIAFSNNDNKHPGPALLDMIGIQLGLSPAPVATSSKVALEQLAGKYLFDDGDAVELFVEDNMLYATSQDFVRRPLVLRSNNAFSYPCTEDYFQIRERLGQTHLVPVTLYGGEQNPGIKL